MRGMQRREVDPLRLLRRKVVDALRGGVARRVAPAGEEHARADKHRRKVVARQRGRWQRSPRLVARRAWVEAREALVRAGAVRAQVAADGALRDVEAILEEHDARRA
eukprot:2362319-Pleurochrysis_carterae.AAC.6